MTIKTREPDDRFKAQVPDFKLEKRKRPRYRTWRDDPDLVEEVEETSPRTNPETGLETSSETGLETSSETGLETSSETGLETSSETGLETSSETGLETSSGTSSGTSSETGSGTSLETGLETSSETGLETSSGTSSETGLETSSETGSGTGSETSSGTSLETSSETGSETSSGTKSRKLNTYQVTTDRYHPSSLRYLQKGPRQKVLAFLVQISIHDGDRLLTREFQLGELSSELQLSDTNIRKTISRLVKEGHIFFEKLLSRTGPHGWVRYSIRSEVLVHFVSNNGGISKKMTQMKRTESTCRVVHGASAQNSKVNSETSSGTSSETL